MLPVVHPGVAYLVYAGVLRIRDRAPPGDLATLALLAGAVLPDVIDQPLFRLVDLPSTRTLGHSLLFLGPVCAIGFLAVRRSSLPDTVGTAFTVGVLSHPAADALWPLAFGLYRELGFLLWPVTESPPYEGVKTLVIVGDVTVTTVWIEIPLLVTALALWWRDGRPGLGLVQP